MALYYKKGLILNILFIQNSFPKHNTGGAAASCRDLILYLNRRGHNINVLTAESNGIVGADNIYNQLKALPKANRSSEYETFINKAKWLLYSRYNYFRTRYLIKKTKADVIYLHNLELTTPSPLLAAVDSGKQVVLHARNLHYADLWKYATGEKKRSVYKYLFKLDVSFDGVRIITVSHFVKQQFIVNGYPENLITTVYNGIVIDNIPQVNLQTQRKRKAIFIGDISPHKGCRIAIEALGILKQEGIEIPIDIYGHIGNPDYYEQCLSLVKHYHLADLVYFCGDQTKNKIYDALSTSEYFLFPSLWEEPFGRVAVEAMACGCIVIGSKRGGIPEVVDDCGLIVEPTPALFAEAIKQCMTWTPKKRQETAEAAWERASKLFRIENTVAAVEKTLSQ